MTKNRKTADKKTHKKIAKNKAGKKSKIATYLDAAILGATTPPFGGI